MSERRALDGDFADIKTVKSRSVVQAIIELPIEKGEELVRLFGFPQPGKPVRVALARLMEPPQIEAKAEPEQPTNGKRAWADLSPAQQAGIHCNDPKFWKFLQETEPTARHLLNADRAADWVRAACCVHSRSELTTNHKARILWRDIDTRFQAWLTAPQAVG